MLITNIRSIQVHIFFEKFLLNTIIIKYYLITSHTTMLPFKQYTRYYLKEANWLEHKSRDTFRDISKSYIQIKIRIHFT